MCLFCSGGVFSKAVLELSRAIGIGELSCSFAASAVRLLRTPKLARRKSGSPWSNAIITALYFSKKAGECRRLASDVLSRHEKTALSLYALAIEFDNQAAALEAETATVVVMSFGDDVGDRLRLKGNGEDEAAAD